jgi:phage terminase large subunit
VPDLADEDGDSLSAEFPKKLAFLFQPHRYKVAYGGRGGAKSWGFARALLIQGASKPLRILCTREVQKSIKESVHTLLSDQIQDLGLGAFYEVLEKEIRGRNGTVFLFAGLKDQTVESIKSYEGVDRCWCEEARAITKRSWSMLTPTIRKPGSEIWVSFNPELDDDEAYKRFVENQPTDCETVKIGYQDNPWFPAVLEQERKDCLRMYPADYKNIWEGECLPAVKGAIYADEVAFALQNKRVTDIPYDPTLKTHVIWDLGWNDSMFLILVQKHLSALRVIEIIEDNHKTYDWYSSELKLKRYNWGNMFLPHDAFHATPETGRTPAQILTSLGWSCMKVPNQPIELGIKTARMGFKQVYFDKTKAERLIQCLKRYKRNIPVNTGEPATPVHDEYSHGADCFRYMSLVAGVMSNEDWKPINYPKSGVI